MNSQIQKASNLQFSLLRVPDHWPITWQKISTLSFKGISLCIRMHHARGREKEETRFSLLVRVLAKAWSPALIISAQI